jgi:RNA polymerase sigma-70 factor (ECF subfamily)
MADLAWIREQLDRYEGPLIRYAHRFTGDLERARDVVQDTFCKLCQQPKESVEDHVCEWLFTVCRNRALDVRKKEGRMTGLNEVELDQRSSGAPAPAVLAEQKDTTSKVLSLIGTLPANQREVVRLKFQDGMSYKEISRITALSVSNVGYLLHMAIKSLRSQLSTGLAQA